MTWSKDRSKTRCVDALNIDRRQKTEVADTAVVNVLVGRRGKQAGGEPNGGSKSVITSFGF